ncbi:MAG TPA: flagellar protein FlgN [Woeseiaceae bacterium]|nr:flagellar protein FlgN [Woeseiaceae bacterium]
MTSHTPADARTRFVELLNDTVFEALGLKEALEEERLALESQDIEAIDRAVANKSACVSKLQRLDRERIDTCAKYGFAAGPDPMSDLIEWCDDNNLIGNRWQQLMIVAAESSALNMTNGAIIRVRQQQFESSLSVLRGVTPGTNTYGRHGGESGDFGHRSLAEA